MNGVVAAIDATGMANAMQHINSAPHTDVNARCIAACADDLKRNMRISGADYTIQILLPDRWLSSGCFISQVVSVKGVISKLSCDNFIPAIGWYSSPLGFIVLSSGT